MLRANKPALSTNAPSRHPGYAISQQKRKRVEEIFGWLKTVAGLRKTRHRGLARVGWMFTLRTRRLQSGSDAQPRGGGSLNHHTQGGKIPLPQ